MTIQSDHQNIQSQSIHPDLKSNQSNLTIHQFNQIESTHQSNQQKTESTKPNTETLDDTEKVEEDEQESERDRELEREIESNLQSFIQSLNYHQSEPESEHDSQTNQTQLTNSLSILSELASNVLPVLESNHQTIITTTTTTTEEAEAEEEAAFHSLLLGSLPQDSIGLLSSTNDHQFHSDLDQHRHAQDLLSALSALQSHHHSSTFDPTHSSSSITFDSIFNPNSEPDPKVHQPQLSNSFSSNSSSENTTKLNDLQPHHSSLENLNSSNFLNHSTHSDLDQFLFEISTPSILNQQNLSSQNQNTDGFDDLLLASIDQHLLNQDLSLDLIDHQTELTLESNEYYSNQIRTLLDQLNLALERGEELESLATHYVNTIQQQTLTSQSQSQSQSPSQSQSQSQIHHNFLTNSSEVNMVILAEGSRTVSLPWFKYKFGQDVPVHEDGTKRDRYNSILHQQAWQVGERRKLEEEIVLQVKQIKMIKERECFGTHSSIQLNPSIQDLIRYSDQIDWIEISKSLPDRSPIECKIQWNQRQNPNLNRTKWKSEEIDKLFEIVKKNHEKDWKSISNQLGTRRTAAECVKQYRMVTQERKEWNENDDLLLKEGVSMYGQNWQAVANHCGRSSNQCINRWSKTLRPDIKKGKWDANEDEALRNAVAACGMVWKDVAPRVRGRTDAQCRERWCNILDPRIVVGNWTPEEDEKILRLRNSESKTWSEISKSFNGRRTDNHCMRRYSELTKSDPKRKQKNSRTNLTKFNRVIQLNQSISKPISLIDRIQPELLLASSSSHHHHHSKNKNLINHRTSCNCTSNLNCIHKSSTTFTTNLGLNGGVKRVRGLVESDGKNESVLKKPR